MRLQSFLSKLLLEDASKQIIEEIMSNENPKIFVLVGPPAVGKSTWIKNNLDGINTVVINRDDIVEEVGSRYSFSYDDMFVTPHNTMKLGEEDTKFGKVVQKPSYMVWHDGNVFDKVIKANDEVNTTLKSRVESAVNGLRNIVVDMTNLNKNSRKNAIRYVENAKKDYIKVAVVFTFKGNEEFIKKIAKKRQDLARKEGKSKTIPDAVYDRMFSSYEDPSDDENFDYTVHTDTIPELKKFYENQKN